MDIKQHIDRYSNYWIIGIVSALALFFLPFLGSAAGLALVLPTTAAGWIVYVATKLIVAIINVLIYHCFFQQAKVNVRDDKRYKEAMMILDKYRIKEQKFRSPEEYTRNAYTKKATTIFLFSILGAFSLTQAILVFDVVMFLTYLFTLIMGVVFGILTMTNAEIYWTEEVLNYAKKIQQEEQNGLQQLTTSQSTTAS